MIVMKFDGSSLASPASLGRVVSIIRTEACRHPIIVASAMGDTADALLELLHGEQQAAMDRFLQDTFRDLHIRMLELCEGERVLRLNCRTGL